MLLSMASHAALSRSLAWCDVVLSDSRRIFVVPFSVHTVVYSLGCVFMQQKGQMRVIRNFPNATVLRPSSIFGKADSFIWYYKAGMRRPLRRMSLWKQGKDVYRAPVWVRRHTPPLLVVR